MSIKIFLDTNVYEHANFSFDNRHFSKLQELIQNDEVILIYNKIVYQEVYQHIEDNLSHAINQYNQVINENRAFAPFRYNTIWSSNIKELNSNDMIKSLQDRWNTFLNDCFAEEIEISSVDIDDIVDKYFKKKLPFENKKPYEFKDAIIIDSIRQYASKNLDDMIFVVSLDKGFRKSFRNNSNIYVFSSLSKAINKIIVQDENSIAYELESQFGSESFISSIITDITNCANNGIVSIEDVYDEVNIIESECSEIQFEYVDFADSKYATVIATACLSFIVEYSERNNDLSYYDREDGEYYWEVYEKYKCEFFTTKEFELHLEIKSENEDLDSLFEYKDLSIDDEFYLKQEEMIESELVETISNDSDELSEFSSSDRYCPDCGCKLTFENDGGAFCINCAPNH